MDWVYLAIGGFLLGSILCCGWQTTRREPAAKPGYALIGTGMALVVSVTTWIDYIADEQTWVRLAVMLGFTMIASGFVLILRERRKATHE